MRVFPGHLYPFRAQSHFLYLTGIQEPGLGLWCNQKGDWFLVGSEQTDEDILWHGKRPSLGQLAQASGLEGLITWDELPAEGLATLLPVDLAARTGLTNILDVLFEDSNLLRLAMIETRLVHDEQAVNHLRQACRLTVKAHERVRQNWGHYKTEAEVRQELNQFLLEEGLVSSFTPIVTQNGSVLHSHDSSQNLMSERLCLVDFGCESKSGWAGDITRVWPTFGHYTEPQREIIALTEKALDWAIGEIAPDKEFRAIHEGVGLLLTEGLQDLGVLRGDLEELWNSKVYTIFFPHGLGHLIGLDVHDMEDLGDLAGYAPGRQRSPLFGTENLRLDRKLVAGMAVTVEPGIYFIDALLEQAWVEEQFGQYLNRDRIKDYDSVSGVRLEDEVLVTEQGCEILSQDLPRWLS